MTLSAHDYKKAEEKEQELREREFKTSGSGGGCGGASYKIEYT